MREPIKRTLTQFLQTGRKYKQRREEGIEAFLLIKNCEVYDSNSATSESTCICYLTKWLEYFDLNQLYTLNGDELTINPIRQLKKLEHLLKVKLFFIPEMIIFNKTNSTNLYPPTNGYILYLRETCKSQNINPICLTLSSPSVSFRS